MPLIASFFVIEVSGWP